MRRYASLRYLGLLIGGSLLVAGCSSSPTYTRENLTQEIVADLARESIEASARLIDGTLAVQFAYPDALMRTRGGSDISIGPGFEEAGRVVITTIHRMLLSSDADVQFYLLLISDPNIPGAYLTMIRYLEDVRKLNVSAFGISEMMSRTFWNLHMVSAKPLTIEEYLPREIELFDFLTWQLTRRIQEELTEALQPAGLASVYRGEGQYSEGEFQFVLNVIPATSQQLDDDTLQLTFDTAAQIIAEVLSNYAFDSFDSVRLIHPLTGRNFILERSQLNLLL